MSYICILYMAERFTDISPERPIFLFIYAVLLAFVFFAAYEMRLNGATMKQIFPDVEGMMRVTLLSEARRIVQWADGPDLYPMPLSAIAIGPVAFIGVPGEGFTGVGLGLKESDDWAVVLPTCITNGSEGYFPMEDCYGEGGYEARSANFKAGTAELICQEGKKLLKELAE